MNDTSSILERWKDLSARDRKSVLQNLDASQRHDFAQMLKSDAKSTNSEEALNPKWMSLSPSMTELLHKIHEGLDFEISPYGMTPASAHLLLTLADSKPETLPEEGWITSAQSKWQAWLREIGF